MKQLLVIMTLLLLMGCGGETIHKYHFLIDSNVPDANITVDVSAVVTVTVDGRLHLEGKADLSDIASGLIGNILP